MQALTLVSSIVVLLCVAQSSALKFRQQRKVCVHGSLKCSDKKLTEQPETVLRLVDTDFSLFGVKDDDAFSNDAHPHHEDGSFQLCGARTEGPLFVGDDHVFEILTKCGFKGKDANCYNRIRFKLDDDNTQGQGQNRSRHLPDIDMMNPAKKHMDVESKPNFCPDLRSDMERVVDLTKFVSTGVKKAADVVGTVAENSQQFSDNVNTIKENYDKVSEAVG